MGVSMMQTMQNWLVEQKAILLPRWLEASFGIYPNETVKFLQRTAGQFANPVGHSVYQGLEVLYDGLAQGIEARALTTAIDKIIRIRAVQDLPAAQAVAFVFQFKQILRQELLKRADNPQQELAGIESAIDALALEVFAVYSACREQLYQIRLAEIKKRQRIPQESLNS
jgi:hypothetical protein